MGLDLCRLTIEPVTVDVPAVPYRKIPNWKDRRPNSTSME